MFKVLSKLFYKLTDDNLSLIEETARRIVHDIATNEQMNALPNYEGDNWLSKYNYLQLLQMPLTFDQLVGQIEYVEEEEVDESPFGQGLDNANTSMSSETSSRIQRDIMDSSKPIDSLGSPVVSTTFDRKNKLYRSVPPLI